MSVTDQGAPAVVVRPQQGGGTVTTIAGGSGGITTVAGGVLDALKTSPVLLLIVLLNGAFIGSAAYYMLQVEAYRAADRKTIVDMLDRCISQTVPIDYLLRSQQSQRPLP